MHSEVRHNWMETLTSSLISFAILNKLLFAFLASFPLPSQGSPFPLHSIFLQMRPVCPYEIKAGSDSLGRHF